MNKKICDIEREDNRNLILKNFKYFSENPEKIKMSKMWKMLNRIWPKYNTEATAKRNHIGEIVSNPRALKSLLAKEYKERLRTRPVKPEMKDIMMTVLMSSNGK